NGNDLVLEPALRDGRQGPFVRTCREDVLLLTCYAKTRRYSLRSMPHRDVSLRHNLSQRPAYSNLVTAHRHARHRFDATSQHDVVCATLNRERGVGDGLQAARTEAVDGLGRYGVRELGDEYRIAGDV